MRLILRAAIGVVLVLGCTAPHAWAAQRDDALMPEQSAAKAKTVLQQVIVALGGPAFLNVRDIDCTGRLAQFGHNRELTGYAQFHDTWLLPDKNRTEYAKNIIELFSGDQGWTLDRGGVSNQPEDALKEFGEQLKSGMNNVLRSRMNEPGVEFRYAGTDLVDLKEAEWIEISDRDQRAFRLAVEKSTHLPMRWVVIVRDPATRERSEEITSYATFVTFDGVRTPIRVSRTQNGREIYQVVFETCKYNSSLDPQLFSRASLEQRYAEVGPKGYKGVKGK